MRYEQERSDLMKILRTVGCGGIVPIAQPAPVRDEWRQDSNRLAPRSGDVSD